MQTQLSAVLARIENREVGELMCEVFQDLTRLLGYLDGVGAARRTGGLSLFLHRFSCYLELLLKHVSMRSVLADAAQELAA